VFVGTNTSQGVEPFLWPSSTLSYSSAAGFDSVVIHYDAPPPTGGDYGPIFAADNMTVTATAVPEPAGIGLLTASIMSVLLRRVRFSPRLRACKASQGPEEYLRTLRFPAGEIRPQPLSRRSLPPRPDFALDAAYRVHIMFG
jgi:hypothetical protein